MCATGAFAQMSATRPSLLKRWNRGVTEPPLFVKRPKSAPTWSTFGSLSARPGRMFAPQDEGDVVWLAQMNCLDLHPWNARASDMEHADELRIDLDPTDEYGFDAVIDVAHTIKEILDELDSSAGRRPRATEASTSTSGSTLSGPTTRFGGPASQSQGRRRDATRSQRPPGGRRSEAASSSTTTRTPGTRPSPLPTRSATPVGCRHRSVGTNSTT